jgi:hypothetical protein
MKVIKIFLLNQPVTKRNIKDALNMCYDNIAFSTFPYIMYKIKYPKTKHELAIMFGNMFKTNDDAEEADAEEADAEDAEEADAEDAEDAEKCNTYFISYNCNYEYILKDE